MQQYMKEHCHPVEVSWMNLMNHFLLFTVSMEAKQSIYSAFGCRPVHSKEDFFYLPCPIMITKITKSFLSD